MPSEEKLISAAQAGDIANVEELLTEENINFRDRGGYTPLNCACFGGHVDIIQLLLDSGAEIKVGKGWTPLHFACEQGKTAAVKLLLDRGAADCVNVPSIFTPLHVACGSKYDPDGDIVRLLIRAGADVNARDVFRRTPAMTALIHGMVNKVKIILDAGAAMNVVDLSGLGLLSYAPSYPEILRILLESGMDVHSRVTLEENRRVCKDSLSILLDYEPRGNILCQCHDSCFYGSVVVAVYSSVCCASLRLSADHIDICRHFFKTRMAGVTQGSSLDKYISLLSCRDGFNLSCEAEVARMKAKLVPGTNATYMDVLHQHPRAMKQVRSLLLEECQAQFPIYGGLIHAKFIMGRRKFAVIEECLDFFTLTDLPHLPSECVAEILSYLPLDDLKNMVCACAPV